MVTLYGCLNRQRTCVSIFSQPPGLSQNGRDAGCQLDSCGVNSCNTGNPTPLVVAGVHPRSIVAVPPQLASAVAVLVGRYGAVTRLAHERGVCRQRLYRDTRAVVTTLADAVPRPRLDALQGHLDELHAGYQRLHQRLRDGYAIDTDRLAAFAATAQAEGVSLPVARRLLAALLARPLDPAAPRQRRLPSVARLGRLSAAAARKASAVRAALDPSSRARVEQGAAADIFFGKKPCLMVIEQHSLAWLSGRLVERRTGEEWAAAFRPLPQLRQSSQDGGSALAKGLALVNQERHQQGRPPVLVQDDHVHVLREGRRALRTMQHGVTQQRERAEAAQRRLARKARRQGDRRGQGTVHQSWQRAEVAFDAWVAVGATWAEIEGALPRFTPEGALNTRARAEAILAAALPRLTGPAWAKVHRLCRRPQLLTFLDQAQQGLAALPAPPEVVAAAVRAEGLRRRPEALRGDGMSARALRGVLLVTSCVLALSGAAGSEAVAQVRGVLRGVWRASSLVECLNSVARMQPGRHRRMTQGLLDLKRLYWNCRAFRTGRRRGQTPYALLGLKLPTDHWWELLQLPPEQLRLALAEPGLPATPPTELSAPTVAA
jgi:hypothetical protein